MSQQMLEDFLRLKNQRIRAEALEVLAGQHLLTMLLMGATVEPGTHDAGLAEKQNGLKITRTLLVR